MRFKKCLPIGHSFLKPPCKQVTENPPKHRGLTPILFIMDLILWHEDFSFNKQKGRGDGYFFNFRFAPSHGFDLWCLMEPLQKDSFFFPSRGNQAGINMVNVIMDAARTGRGFLNSASGEGTTQGTTLRTCLYNFEAYLLTYVCVCAC